MSNLDMLLREHQNQCRLAKDLFNFLRQYNGYDVIVNLDKFKREDLCIGSVEQRTNSVWLNRDFFTTYPSLTYDWEFFNDCCLLGLEYPETDVVKILRTDGEISVKGILNKYRAETYHSLNIVPKDILGYGRREFVDEAWSKEINGKPYYVIDLFRAKKHDKGVIKAISNAFGAYRNKDITKTLYICKGKNQGEYEVGLWDILKECPMDK